MSEYIVCPYCHNPLSQSEYVKVVRCRDCKFCDYDVFAYWCCREKYQEFEVDSLDGERMGFCAWGERRTDD